MKPNQRQSSSLGSNCQSLYQNGESLGVVKHHENGHLVGATEDSDCRGGDGGGCIVDHVQEHQSQNTEGVLGCSDTLDASSSSRMIKSESSQRLQELRESMGDYGVALFAPLLDYDTIITLGPLEVRPQQVYSEDNNFNVVGFSSFEKSTFFSSLSTCTNISIQTDEPETDLPRSSDMDEENSDDDDESLSSSVHFVIECPMRLSDCPRILSSAQMADIQRHLPTSMMDRSWIRCFSIGLHGDSFYTLLQKCAPFQYSLVVMETVAGEILGGFASATWRVHEELGPGGRRSYFGTGQSFVFASHPATTSTMKEQVQSTGVAEKSNDDSSELHVYKWTGDNDYCQICDNDRGTLCMGGVGEFGWIVSDNFTTGQTGACATFGNPPLCTNGSTSFAIAGFEIYGLASSIFNF